jgi:taurine dioxygenase
MTLSTTTNGMKAEATKGDATKAHATKAHATKADAEIMSSTVAKIATEVVTKASTFANKLTLVPYSPTIGAEVSGISLADDLAEKTINELRAALLEWKVLFFRDQDITTEAHLAFARRFGSLECHPFAPSKPGYPEVLAITHNADSPGKENAWHSDVTWRIEPSLGSILVNKVCPSIGGDTLFADMYAAYDGLPQRIKDRVDGQVAVHDFANFRSGLKQKGATQEQLDAFDLKYPNPQHPVVRTHPETGRRAIYVNIAFTKYIVGMEKSESDELLQIMFRQASVPEYQCRFRWQQHSVAFWDNRSTQHYASSDYWPNRRDAERVTIVGDAPFFDASFANDYDGSRFKGAVERFSKS